MLSGNTVHISHAVSSHQEATAPFLVPKSPVYTVTIVSVFTKQDSRNRGRTGSWEVLLFLTSSPGEKKGDVFGRPRALLGWKESTAIHIIEAEILAHL